MGLARYYMSKIDRKIQSNIAKARCRDERGRFVKKRACQTHTHSQPSRDKTYSYFLAFVLLFALLAATVLVFAGCNGPRSATMCLKNGFYVKCPKGVEVGTELK